MVGKKHKAVVATVVCLSLALTVQAQTPAPTAQATAPATSVPASTEKTFSQEELDQLVAPIALYPDALLAQALMASTYPLDVVSAERWVKANPGLKDKALEDALQNQPWDPSVKSLCVFPQVLTMAAGDPGRFAQIAALVALVFAAISFIAWLLRLSSLVSFISETILLGFKAGAAITIAMTQLPKLFGVPGGSGDFFERLWKLGSQLPDTQPVVLAFGICAIALLIVGDKLLPARPIALFVVAASIVALSVTPLAQLGFKTVGVLPAGLPDFMLPSLRARDIDGIVPLALACFLLAYIEGISSARALAQKHGDEIDPRQELFALGAANLAAAVCQGYPVAGGLSQSTVNDKAGAKTPLSVVLASVTIALCLLFLTGLLRNLPDVVLAAIVLVAVKGLINIPELRRVWTLSRTEFLIAVAAFAGVLLLGILKGVLLAAAFSIALLVNRAAHPHACLR